MRTTLAITANELRLVGKDPAPIVLLIIMPLLLLAFLSRGMVGGPAASVPGLLLLFGFFGITPVGIAFYRDHGWQTWNRLRLTPAPIKWILVGKALPLALLFVIQDVVLLLSGRLIFDMPFHGSIAWTALVIVVITMVELGIALALVSICRTINQISTLGNVSALLLAGVGGALTPVAVLPAWARHLAPVSPIYWGIRAIRVATIESTRTGQLTKPLLVLAAMGLGSIVVAVAAFRTDQSKRFFA